LYLQHEYDQAIVQFRKILEIDPNNALAHFALSDAYLAKGMHTQGLEEGVEYLRSNGQVKHATEARDVFARTGYRGALLHRISIESNPADLHVYFPWNVARNYARLGDREKAFYWLERCYTEQAGLTFLKVEPAFDSLHSDPRYADLLRRIGLPQ
jgi:tetratricopeptide (TPR) repeat protein